MKKEIKSALVQDENNQNELNSGQSLESSMYGESPQNDNSQSVTSIGAAASVSSFSRELQELPEKSKIQPRMGFHHHQVLRMVLMVVVTHRHLPSTVAAVRSHHISPISIVFIRYIDKIQHNSNSIVDFSKDYFIIITRVSTVHSCVIRKRSYMKYIKFKIAQCQCGTILILGLQSFE